MRIRYTRVQHVYIMLTRHIIRECAIERDKPAQLDCLLKRRYSWRQWLKLKRDQEKKRVRDMETYGMKDVETVDVDDSDVSDVEEESFGKDDIGAVHDD